MSISEKQVIKILREEYNKRINHFLEEKITIKDKRGMNLVKDAIGLKVRDKAGFEYTIGGVVNKDGAEYIKLYLPEFGRDSTETPATSGLNEFDKGFIVRSDGSKTRNGLDVSSGFAGKDYLDDSGKGKKYIEVPMGEFEAKFEI